MTTTPTDPLSGFAALGPGDLRDARRRRPGADLSGYATERGLETLGSASAAGYLAAMPGDEALQFNVLRGSLPGGAHGILFHHRHAWRVDLDGRAAGTFYGKYYSSGGSVKDTLRPDPWAVLSGLPYVGWLFDLAGPPRVSHDGRRQAVGVPCTVAAALVPEAAACADFSIDNRAKPAFVAGHRERLGSLDLRGWDLTAVVAPNPALVQRLLSGPLLARLRAAAELPYFRLELSHGTVIVETNGYLDDGRRLDWLACTLSIAAAEVRDACRALADERPFSDQLPPADWPDPPRPRRVAVGSAALAPVPGPPEPWRSAIRHLATATRMTLEDEGAFHRAFPSAPVPGRAFAVMRGTIPGTPLTGRLVFSGERPLPAGAGRNAVLVPIDGGTADMPPGGVREAGGGASYAVRDGVLAVSARRVPALGNPLGDVPGLIESALRIRRQLRPS